MEGNTTKENNKDDHYKDNMVYVVDSSVSLGAPPKSLNKEVDTPDRLSQSGSDESSEQRLPRFDKYAYTFLLCYANMTYGICITCMSPALLDYTCVLNQDAEVVSHFFTLFAIGTIIGSCFGFLFKYINRQLTLIIALSLYGLTTVLTPMTPGFIVFYLFGLMAGIGSGCLDIVQTVWLIEMWDEKSAAAMQMAEFTYGLGIIIGPLLVQPYIFDDDDCVEYEYENVVNYGNVTTEIPVSITNKTILSRAEYGRKLYTPFFTSGGLMILGAVLLAAMFFYHKYVPEIEEADAIEHELAEVLRPIEKLYQRRYTITILDSKTGQELGGGQGTRPGTRNSSLKRPSKGRMSTPRFSIEILGERRGGGSMRQRHSAGSLGSLRGFRRRKFSSFQLLDQKPREEEEDSTLPRKTIICLGALCFATMIASESAYVDFAPSFFKFYSEVPPAQTAELLAVMTGAYTLTRMVCIFVATRVRPEIMLVVHYGITAVGIVVLYFTPGHMSVTWCGSILYGIGIAPMWSATFSHIEHYFEVTDRICTIYVSALGLLEISTQFIEGPFLDKFPVVLIYYCATAMVISFSGFIAIRVIVWKCERADRNRPKLPDTLQDDTQAIKKDRLYERNSVKRI